jgi:hypothetical protein
MLDDEEPDTLSTFVLWLYDRKLSKATLPCDDDDSAVEKYLFRLYVFADKRDIGNLANDTITMLPAWWTETKIDLGAVSWVILLISRSSKLYDLILDNSVLDLRSRNLGRHRLGALELPQEFLVDLLIRSEELSDVFRGGDKCYQAMCHYHCHVGQGIMSEEDCIRNIEAGWNTYHNIKALEQRGWEGAVW